MIVKRIIALAVVFLMLLSCMPVVSNAAQTEQTQSTGVTYYVSSSHGAEGNSGTSESAPFNSLLKINEITLQPGDRVLLERGSVFRDEYLHVKGSGSAEAPIIIDAYGDENQPKPLIQTNGQGVWYQDYGKRLDNTWHKYQGNVSSCILLYDVEYIEISNIAMTNEGNFAEGEVYNTYGRMDRTGVAGIAENIGTVDHIYLRDLDIRNVQGSVHDKHMANGGIYLLCHNPDNESSTGVSKFDDVLIEGCRLDEVNRWGIAVGYTAYWDRFTYGPTIDPDICQTYGSTDVVIRNNYLTNVGGDGITTMYCYQPLIEYNVLDGYCQDMTLDIYGNNNQRVAAGIWPWMCKSPVLQYNEAYNSTYCPDAQAWDADWGDNAIYQYNYSCNNAGGAVMFCGQYACNTVFRYNISQNDLDGVLNLASSPNGEIYNNVFYIKEGVKINRTGMSGGRGNSIYNNIFYYTGETPADATLGNWGDITAEWSNNIYYNYSTIPSDPYAITADPQFVDPGKAPTGAQESGKVHDRSVFDGYKLREDSPAIDAGKAVTAAGKVGLNAVEGANSNLDFFGNKLDMIPDIGVYETGRINIDAETFEKVSVPVGETVKLTDETGAYTDADVSELDTTIATVDLSTKTSFGRALGDSVTSLTTGKYLIYNNRASKPMTNDDASQDADAGNMTGLRLNGSKDDIAENAVWTITVENGSCTIQDADNKYLTISNNDANLSDTATNVDVVYNTSGGYWTLDQNNFYLNDAANKATCASGWMDSTASTDSGSQWTLYKVVETETKVTELTFTGVYPGMTNMKLGDTLYMITVPGFGVDKTELPAAGGEITVKIVGTDLEDGIDVKAGDLTAKTSGTATEQTATLTIPANESEEEVTYTIQYSLDGETYTGEIKVTVAAAEKEDPKPSDPDDTDPKPSEPEDNDPKPSEPEEDEPKYELPECPKDATCVLSQFSDVKTDDWYHDGVHFCVDHGIVNGMGNGTFAPNDPTTRAQLVTMLYRLEGEPSIDGMSEPFTDVSENDWFYAPIVWAYNNKVVNGMTETTFAPDAKITREQVATILHRYLGTPAGSGDLSGYPDADKVQDYAKDALTWAVGEGLINGVAQTDGTSLLAPDGNATRAQIATILMRYLTA